MTTRRSFLSGILAAATPPGFVRAGVLMPVAPVIVTPESLPWGVADLVAWVNQSHEELVDALRSGHVYGSSIVRSYPVRRA